VAPARVAPAPSLFPSPQTSLNLPLCSIQAPLVECSVYHPRRLRPSVIVEASAVSWLPHSQTRPVVRSSPASYVETNCNLLQKEFDAYGYQILYTPPYECECQPIEMLWAYVKNYAARVMGDDHCVAIVTQLTHQGLYGDPANDHATVTLLNTLFFIVFVHIYCM